MLGALLIRLRDSFKEHSFFCEGLLKSKSMTAQQKQNGAAAEQQRLITGEYSPSHLSDKNSCEATM
jgi:hypothetical protein